MTRLHWKRVEDDSPKGAFYANVPKGIVRDQVLDAPASRVWRWPVGRSAWRVSLGVVAGPRGPKYQCSDLGVAVAVAEELVETGRVALPHVEGDDGVSQVVGETVTDLEDALAESLKSMWGQQR